jgi:transcriptional regulator with XRE-family HTH domain
MESNLAALIGQRVLELRKDQELTQDQLADISGVPQGTISRLERGVSGDVQISTVQKLATALGVSIEGLLTPSPETDDMELEAAVAQLVGA